MPDGPGEGIEERAAAAHVVRPTSEDRSVSWLRPAVLVLSVVVGLLAVALVVALVQDRGGAYPGHRSAESIRSLTARVAPPTDARVDGFERPGRLRSVGPYPWRVAVGRPWVAAAGVARAAPGGGTVLVDPGRASVLVQADVFRPVPGAGLVFRWRDAANHFSVEVAPARDAWLLVRTEGGVRTELGRVAVAPQGSNVRLALTGSDVVLTVNGQQRVDDHDDRALAGATAVGLSAPTDETRFDAFALLVG